MPGLFTTVATAEDFMTAGCGGLNAASIHPSGRRPREDALPEHVNYRDEGRDLFSSCLTCPLPRCRFDEPGGARTMLNVVRDVEIRHQHDTTCLTVDDIAARFRISRHTVFRVLQIGRGGSLRERLRTHT